MQTGLEGLVTVLLKTVHGSHLYGFARPDSDLDYYTVVSDNPTRRPHYSTQTIRDGLDSNVLDLSTFLHQVHIGVPQACEALYSRMAEIDLISDLRQATILGPHVWARYLRTIKSFALTREESPLYYKRKRHALRLGLNLGDIAFTGRFNPTLTPSMAATLSILAEQPGDDVYETALQIAGF